MTRSEYRQRVAEMRRALADDDFNTLALLATQMDLDLALGGGVTW